MKNWLKSVFGKEEPIKESFVDKDSVVPPFLKEAAYTMGETLEQTIALDWDLRASALSDFVLAEQITEWSLQNNGEPEKYAAAFQENLDKVHKNRKKAEQELLKLVPRHSQLGVEDFFKRIKEQAEKENEAKARSLKKSAAGAKWKSGDELCAKHNNAKALVMYVNSDDKTYTIKVGGVMTPTYYSWEDAHETFEKYEGAVEKAQTKSTKEARFVVEKQLQNGFWEEVRSSTFKPDIELKATIMQEEDPSVNIRIKALFDAPKPEFKKNEEIHSNVSGDQGPYKVLEVDDENGLYLVHAPGFKQPVKYTFEVAHTSFGHGAPESPVLHGPHPKKDIPQAERMEGIPEHPPVSPEAEEAYRKEKEQNKKEKSEAPEEKLPKQLPPEPWWGWPNTLPGGRKSSKEKSIDVFKVALTDKAITMQFPNGNSSISVFASAEIANTEFDKITSLTDLVQSFSLDVLAGNEEKENPTMVFQIKGKQGWWKFVKYASTLNWEMERVSDNHREVVNSGNVDQTNPRVILAPGQKNPYTSVKELSEEEILNTLKPEAHMDGADPRQNQIGPKEYAEVMDTPKCPHCKQPMKKEGSEWLCTSHMPQKTNLLPEGSEGDPSMGVAPMGGTGVFVEPSRGGASVMQTSLKKAFDEEGYERAQDEAKEISEPLAREELRERLNNLGGAHDLLMNLAKEKGYDKPKDRNEIYKWNNDLLRAATEKLIPEKNLKIEWEYQRSQDPSDTSAETTVWGPGEYDELINDMLLEWLPFEPESVAASLEGQTFNVGENAILNARVGSLEEGSEITILGVQNTNVIFESSFDPTIKGFTKFSKLDKIATQEKYQWENEELKSPLELGDTVKVGNIIRDGRELKGKMGTIVDKIMVSPTEGNREMYYHVEIHGEQPIILPADVLKKAKGSKKASLSPQDEDIALEARLATTAKIVHKDNKWCVMSETSDRSMGCYPTKPQALKRLRQVEFFKHKNANLDTLTADQEVELLKEAGDSIAIELNDISMEEGAKLTVKPRELPEGIVDALKEKKEAVLKPNLDAAQEFLKSFKIPPTVVSDIMVKEYLQTNNLTATKDDLKEIYTVLHSSNIDVRITTPEAAAPEAKSALTADEHPATLPTHEGIAPGTKVSYTTVEANEIDSRPAGTEVTGRVILVRGDKTASVMWDDLDLGTTHGLEISALKKIEDKTAVKYQTEIPTPEGANVIVEKELPQDLGPQIKIKQPDGSEDDYKKAE